MFVPDLYEDHGFFQRLTMINKEYPGANIVLHKLQKLPKVDLCKLLLIYSQTLALKVQHVTKSVKSIYGIFLSLYCCFKLMINV